MGQAAPHDRSLGSEAGQKRRGIGGRGIVREGHPSPVGVVEKKSVSGAWRAGLQLTSCRA